MTQSMLIPYLNFNGNTKEAMQFYHKVLGGELTVQTYRDTPGTPAPPGLEDNVIHSRLDADGFVIMASDGRPGEKVNFGDNINLSLQGSDEPKLTRAFKGLSEGGKVGMQLEKQFWGDTYGQFTDKFGVNWQVNITKE